MPTNRGKARRYPVALLSSAFDFLAIRSSCLRFVIWSDFGRDENRSGLRSMDSSFLSRAARRAINTISRLLGLAALFLIAYPGALLGTGDSFPANYIAGTLIQLNDNGAWSWFMDPRAIVDDGKLIVGSVRAIGTFQSGASDPRWGNVEIAVYDITAKKDRHDCSASASRAR